MYAKLNVSFLENNFYTLLNYETNIKYGHFIQKKAKSIQT
jgi:hypothetical protein